MENVFEKAELPTVNHTKFRGNWVGGLGAIALRDANRNWSRNRRN